MDAAVRYNAYTGRMSELSHGPEYLITVSIADRLRKSVSPSYVYPEDPMGNVYEPMTAPPKSYGKSKRYDVILRGSDKRSEVGIEVKNRVYSPTKLVLRDLERLIETLKLSDSGDPILDMGIFCVLHNAL